MAGSDLDNGAAPHKINIPISQYSLHTEGPMREGGVLQWLAVALKDFDKAGLC